MFSSFVFICCFLQILCNDHIEEFLRNKTVEDIVGLRQHFQRTMYLQKQQEQLSDSSQPDLILLAEGDVLPCEANWHQYASTGCCYRVSDAKSDWYGGTAVCQALNADAQMASLHSQEESKFIANKYTSIHAWTGLSQTQVPNTWTYTDGTPDWHWFPALSSAPSDAGHSCVEMMDGLLGIVFALSLQKGQTNSYDCTEVNQIICKYCPRETTSTPTTTTTVTTTTVTTTTLKTTRPTTTTSTASTAKTSVTTPTTTTTKATTTSTKAATTPTTTSTTTKTTTTTKATTATTATTKITTTNTPATCISTCPSPTVSFNNKCYKMCSGSVNFEDSCSWCGGTMTTITSEEQNNFISRVFGANDQTNSQIWIGNTESSEYLNWVSGQNLKPNDGKDYCISMELSAGPTKGKYRYLPCQSTVVNSVCVMNS